MRVGSEIPRGPDPDSGTTATLRVFYKAATLSMPSAEVAILAVTDRDRSFRDEALPQLEAVHRFALRLAGDTDRAEDLVQETFRRAYRHWDTYTPETRIKSRLFTICRNTFLRHEERSRRHEDIVAREAEEDPRSVSRESAVFQAVVDRDPEGTFWSRVVENEVLRAIDALPGEFRDAVVLSDLEDLSYEEIARVTDVPVGTVKSRLFRGRRILQKTLYEYALSSGIISGSSEVWGAIEK